MLRHTLLLLFLYGIRSGTGRPQNDVAEAREEIRRDGMRKSEVGANGSGIGSGGGLLRNFRNPVLEYLLNKDNLGNEDAKRKGIIREIRHGQTIVLPQGNFGATPNKASEQKPVADSVANMYEYANSHKVGMLEKFVSSPVLHLNKSQSAGEWTKMETLPAAVVVNTYNADGTLKSSATHYWPSITVGAAATPMLYAPHMRHIVPAPSLALSSHPTMIGLSEEKPPAQRISWPFAGYFPIVINDPFLVAYKGITTSMYNTLSSMVEYGPDADICRKNEEKDNMEKSNKTEEGSDFAEVTLDAEVKLIRTATEKKEERENSSDRVAKEPERVGTKEGGEVSSERKRRNVRDTTGIRMNFKNGDKVKVEVEEPNPRSLLKRAGHSDLVLRKGGIAIAGPGGAATAYTGGTAIVGPYGTVYKSPEGTAIMGPHSRVINITDDMSFEDILKLHQSQKKGNGVAAPNRRAAAGRKFKNYKNYFSYWTDLPINIEEEGSIRREEEGKVVRLPAAGLVEKIENITKGEFTEIAEDLAKDERVAKWNETLLVFRPKAKAEAGRKGIALSAPISHAILFPNRKANIRFEPESVASAGPGGFAHAHSDLFLSYFRRR